MEKIKEKIKENNTYFAKALRKKEPISFFDWECPPRKLRIDKKGQIWFDFDLPLEKIVNGQKVDEFTELPKILTKEKETREILSIMEKNYSGTSLIKLVADTNWLYLYPQTLKNIGKKRLKEIAKEFEFLLQKKSNEMFGRNKIRVINFTRLQEGFEKEYKLAFDEAIENYERIVPDKIKKRWENYLVIHVGLSKKERSYRKKLTKRVIASYAAEGIIFDLLDKAKIMPNPVLINFDEPIFAVESMEILRKKRGIKPLLKIFLPKKV